MIAGEGRTIYVSGDTDVMADMAVFEDLHHPEIGILCAGGHFTMDMKRAAYAARKFFNFKTVIPCHYRTFPMLEQSAEALRAELPGVRRDRAAGARADRALSEETTMAMTFDAAEPPAALAPPLQALWWLKKGGLATGPEWERAHEICQAAEGTPGL